MRTKGIAAGLALGAVLAVSQAGCNRSTGGRQSGSDVSERSAAIATTANRDRSGEKAMVTKLEKTDAEWRETLTPEQYKVLREKGTERAFTGEYWKSKTPGMYLCAGCGQELFDSEHKYDSGTGWPSFGRPADEGAVETEADRSSFMSRTEVHCSRCGGHLGHVFDDGPDPKGLRYCINSAALKLAEEREKEK